MSLFGSVLGPEFHCDSDVDVMVEYQPGTVWDFDDYDFMREELEAMFGRRIDLVPARAVKNPFIRASIFENRRVIHAA